MYKNKVYKVLFKGIILPGYDKEQVIENVHNITRIPKEIIARKFFSGKTVVIRHADTQDYASRLQKKFAQAGIETYIKEIIKFTPPDQQEDYHEDKKQSILQSEVHSPELLSSETKGVEAISSEDQINQQSQTSIESTADKPEIVTTRKPVSSTSAILIFTLFVIVAAYFLYNSTLETLVQSPPKVVENKDSKVVEKKDITEAVKKDIPADDMEDITEAVKIDIPADDMEDITAAVKKDIPADDKEDITEAVKEDITLETKEKETKKPSPVKPFLSAGEINVLIKITDKKELHRLSGFLPLLNIEPTYIEFLLQEIGQRDSMFSLSANKPLYFYKASQHKGIVISLGEKNSKTLLPDLKIKQFQEKMDSIHNRLQSNSNCANNTLNLYRTNNLLVLTSLSDKQQLKNLDTHLDPQLNSLPESSLQKKEFIHPLLKLDSLFKKSESIKLFAFNFYYSNSYTEQKLLDQESAPSDYLAFSAQENLFWYAPGKQFYNKSKDLQKTLGVHIDKVNVLSSLKLQNLSNMCLLLLSQTFPENFIKESLTFNSKESNFIQQQITQLMPAFSTKRIKPFQNDLDIEFKPQWQGGPFALTTNNFQFDQQLVIELLAKGQNIENLMEYSQSAKLITHAVYNNNNENILDNSPSANKKPLTNKSKECLEMGHTESYFVDLDGKQEAYIDNDFTSYHTITAKEQIRIQPSYKLQDIAQIKGVISLQLPRKISQKLLRKSYQNHTVQFKDFALILNKQSDKKTLSYQLVDYEDHFISLRAYSDSGKILETTSFEKHSILNNHIRLYQQSFSEEISRIKVFYTDKKEKLTYPFTLKPKIIAVSNPLNTFDRSPVAFQSTSLDLNALSEQALSDNPQWLGKKVADKVISPLHVSLFIRNTKKQDAQELTSNATKGMTESQHKGKDAVLNIKSTLTPLFGQNITAVSVFLSQNSQVILDGFVAFSEKELPNKQENSYLNANLAFHLDGSSQKEYKETKGVINLNLPNSFETHSNEYYSPGQVIKLEGLLITLIRLTRQEAQFEISGKFQDIVQLKLYNAKNKLISEFLEFMQIQKDKALLTLRYNDQIDSIKLILSQSSTRKSYPFSFTN